MSKRTDTYSAGLMSESPWFHGFKKIVAMIHDGVAREEIKRQCIEENLLGMPKEYRARRTYGYLLNRVNLMDQELIDLFIASDLATQKLINFITVILGDRLFFELINEVYREKVYLGYPELLYSDINSFLTDKAGQSEDMKVWKDTTFKKLREVYLLFMTDANLLSREKNIYSITPPVLDASLERYLQDHRLERIQNALTGVR